MRLRIATVAFAFLVFCGHVAMAHDLNFFNKLEVQTVGNHSYVRIGVYDTPDKYASQILTILEEFEKSNPDKDVTGWKMENQQRGYGMSSYIFGLWIDHKPKVK